MSSVTTIARGTWHPVYPQKYHHSVLSLLHHHSVLTPLTTGSECKSLGYQLHRLISHTCFPAIHSMMRKRCKWNHLFGPLRCLVTSALRSCWQLPYCHIYHAKAQLHLRHLQLPSSSHGHCLNFFLQQVHWVHSILTTHWECGYMSHFMSMSLTLLKWFMETIKKNDSSWAHRHKVGQTKPCNILCDLLGGASRSCLLGILVFHSWFTQLIPPESCLDFALDQRVTSQV